MSKTLALYPVLLWFDCCWPCVYMNICLQWFILWRHTNYYNFQNGKTLRQFSIIKHCKIFKIIEDFKQTIHLLIFKSLIRA